MAAGLLTLTLLAWAHLLAGGGMGVDVLGSAKFSLFPHKEPPSDSMAAMDMAAIAGAAPEPLGVGSWLVGFGMWSAMMAAMMTPAAAPAILLYGRVRAHADGAAGRGRIAPAAVFALGYLLVWLGFSALAASLQGGLEAVGALSSAGMVSGSRWFSGAVLLAAGAYQLCPVKHACLRQCRSPAQFLSRHWRPGVPGALRLGLLHGAYCLGCCWLFMGLLFVGGVMNLAWIAALTLLVMAEKLGPAGPALSRAVGVVLITWGLATLSA